MEQEKTPITLQSKPETPTEIYEYLNLIEGELNMSDRRCFRRTILRLKMTLNIKNQAITVLYCIIFGIIAVITHTVWLWLVILVGGINWIGGFLQNIRYYTEINSLD